MVKEGELWAREAPTLRYYKGGAITWVPHQTGHPACMIAMDSVKTRSRWGKCKIFNQCQAFLQYHGFMSTTGQSADTLGLVNRELVINTLLKSSNYV